MGGQAGVPRLYHRHVSAHRLALHPGGRPGPRHAEPVVVRAEHDRGTADVEHLHLRSETARVRYRQPARRRSTRHLGCVALFE